MTEKKPVSSSNTLAVETHVDETLAHALADYLTNGIATNAVLTAQFFLSCGG